MKKLSILALCLFIGIQVKAQNPKHFLGEYYISNGPFEKIIVTLENDKLYGNAVGEGIAELKPTKIADTYEVVGYDSEIKFIRNDKNIVNSLVLNTNGRELSGNRIIPALSDYEGNYIMKEGPVSSMEITVEDGVVMANVPNVGKGPLDETSIIDQLFDKEYGSDILFSRNNDDKVDSVFIKVQGMTLIGAKEMMVTNPYIGFYEFESAPISELEVTAKDGGDLFGSSDQGDGTMKKTEDPDVFKLIEYDGEVIFQRSSDGSVNGLILKVQGNEMTGVKRK